MDVRARRMWGAIVLFMGVHPAVACAADEWTWFDSWHADQDLLAPGNEDRNYTMGLRFNWYGDKAERIPMSMLPLLARIDGALGFQHAGEVVLPTVSLGGNAFTPDDLRAREPVLEDRPYASLLYVATSVAVPSQDQRSARGSKLVIGALGLPVADWLQTGIHKGNRAITGGETPYDPEGWHNQISDGGELTAMYQRSWMWRLAKEPVPSRPRRDAAGSCDVSVGYQTGLSCGVVGKWWGRADAESASAPFWAMLDELTPQGDTTSLMTTTGERYFQAPVVETADFSRDIEEKRWISEWYVLFGLRARLVGYNELMQGGFRDSQYTVDSGDIERVVWEGSIGFNLTLRNRSRVMLTCTQHSPEHELSERRSHRWCGINYYLKPPRR